MNNESIHNKKMNRKNAYIFTSVIVIMVIIILGITLIVNSTVPVYAIKTPNYPKANKYDDYDANIKKQEQDATIDKDFLSNVRGFSLDSSSKILGETNKEKNSLYSPISLYMAAAMLTETASGTTQQELLSALNMNNIEIMSKQTNKLYNSLFIDDGIAKLKLANSVWLDKGIKFNKDILGKLADEYYASSFSVDFKKKDTAQKISEWINENTGKKLGKNAKDFEASANQIMALYNTIYFYNEWSNQFDKENTIKDKFNLTNGKTVDCDFMNSHYDTHGFIKGDGYISSKLYLKQGQYMQFMLPDKGVSPYDIISDNKKLTDAILPVSKDKEERGEVIFKIPKFDFSTKVELNDALKSLGVKSAFDKNNADFSKLSDIKPTYVSKVSQASTIAIDEKGVEAAAYTEIQINTTAMPQKQDKKVEMILDRPFIFSIMSENDIPLFIGVVNNPNLK